MHVSAIAIKIKRPHYLVLHNVYADYKTGAQQRIEEDEQTRLMMQVLVAQADGADSFGTEHTRHLSPMRRRKSSLKIKPGAAKSKRGDVVMVKLERFSVDVLWLHRASEATYSTAVPLMHLSLSQLEATFERAAARQVSKIRLAAFRGYTQYQVKGAAPAFDSDAHRFKERDARKFCLIARVDRNHEPKWCPPSSDDGKRPKMVWRSQVLSSVGPT